MSTDCDGEVEGPKPSSPRFQTELRPESWEREGYSLAVARREVPRVGWEGIRLRSPKPSVSAGLGTAVTVREVVASHRHVDGARRLRSAPATRPLKRVSGVQLTWKGIAPISQPGGTDGSHRRLAVAVSVKVF